MEYFDDLDFGGDVSDELKNFSKYTSSKENSTSNSSAQQSSSSTSNSSSSSSSSPSPSIGNIQLSQVPPPQQQSQQIPQPQSQLPTYSTTTTNKQTPIINNSSINKNKNKQKEQIQTPTTTPSTSSTTTPPTENLPEPIVQNIVSTVNLQTKLDLTNIALHARNAEYNPRRFAAVIMRIKEPKTTALIFQSGKVVVAGAKSERDSKIAAKKFARIIKKLNFQPKFTEFKIQNIVASVDVKFPIRLEGLTTSEHANYISYEPELFPGLVYRMISPKVVLLIFVSGKIVLTGAKSREDIKKGFKAIYPLLHKYKNI